MMEHNLCRRCLRRHVAGACKVNKECGVNGCKFKHHSLIHDDQKHSQITSTTNDPENKVVTTNVSGSHISFYGKVILRIVPVTLHWQGCLINTFAFLDEGSTTTLMDQRIADALKLKGERQHLCILWSGNVHRTEKNSIQVEVMISSKDDHKCQFRLRGVKTVQCLGIPAQSLDRNSLCKQFSHLQRASFSSYENGVTRILIGSNNLKIGVPQEVVECEPVAFRTRMWTYQ